MLKLKLPFNTPKATPFSTFLNFKGTVDFSRYETRIKMSIQITGEGTKNNPYVIVIKEDCKFDLPELIIYESDSFIEIKDSKVHRLVVEKCENVVISDCKFKWLNMIDMVHGEISNVMVRKKAIVMHCDELVFRDFKVKKLSVHKIAKVLFSECDVGVLLKSQELFLPQLVNSQIHKEKEWMSN